MFYRLDDDALNLSFPATRLHLEAAETAIKALIQFYSENGCNTSHLERFLVLVQNTPHRLQQ